MKLKTVNWEEKLRHYLQLFEKVEHGHAHHDDREGAHYGDHVHSRHAPPLLEEDDGGGEDDGGEEDVVDGVNKQSVEGVQRLVQVVHLWTHHRTTAPPHRDNRQKC